MKSKAKDSRASKLAAGRIVIDEPNGLVFDSEDELYHYFLNEITQLEAEFLSLRNGKDLPESDFKTYEEHLAETLDEPDEVWEDHDSLDNVPLTIYIKNFSVEDGVEEVEPLYHVAVCYMTKNVPSFVYLHFPTRDGDLIEKYRRGELIYENQPQPAVPGAIEGDALFEGDELAVGLYTSMLKVRSEKDISEQEFQDYENFREVAVEEADEIWRNADSMGNVLVTFIREFPDELDTDLFYIVVTLEDAPSNSHALLFSFPTRDKSLVDRYRHGENLQAEEVVQEASH